MPRESGASSTARPFDSITGASEYWIARFRGAMTTHMVTKIIPTLSDRLPQERLETEAR
jgi:hypothetical protein